MDFTFSETEREVAQLARTILGDLATNERLREHEQSGAEFSTDVWKALADADLLGVAVPDADGGSGIGFLALCRLLQEVGRAVAPVPAFASLALGALAIVEFGDAESRSLLRSVVDGTTILTAALHEPDASDPRVPSTRIDGSGRCTGVKTLVPFGSSADRILVPAQGDDGAIALAWFTRDSQGVSIAAQRGADGLPAAQITLQAAVPVDRLDRDGNGRAILEWLVDRAVAARAMMQLGVLERALEMTAAYGRERVQFERTIGSFQAFHQRAADAYMHVESLRLTAWEAAWRLSESLDATPQVEVAKFCAAEAGAFVSYACQHLHGGVGIDVDYPLHRYFKWAVQMEHEFGSAQHQLSKIGHRIATGGVPIVA